MINTTVILIAFLAAMVFILKGFVKVEADEKAIVERFGRFNRMLEPGLHFIMPIAESLRGLQDPQNHNRYLNSKKICLSPKTMLFPKDDRAFFASSNHQYKLKCEVVYQITDPFKAVYEVVYLFDALNQLIAGIVQKRLIEKEDHTNPIESIGTICAGILEACNDYALNWGVKIIDIKLKQVIDSNGIRHNLEKK